MTIANAAIAATGRPVSAAALNAGVGRGGAFVDNDLSDEIEVIDLNISSTVLSPRGVAGAGRGTGRVLPDRR